MRGGVAWRYHGDLKTFQRGLEQRQGLSAAIDSMKVLVLHQRHGENHANSVLKPWRFQRKIPFGLSFLQQGDLQESFMREPTVCFSSIAQEKALHKQRYPQTWPLSPQAARLPSPNYGNNQSKNMRKRLAKVSNWGSSKAWTKL